MEGEEGGVGGRADAEAVPKEPGILYRRLPKEDTRDTTSDTAAPSPAHCAASEGTALVGAAPASTVVGGAALSRTCWGCPCSPLATLLLPAMLAACIEAMDTPCVVAAGTSWDTPLASPCAPRVAAAATADVTSPAGPESSRGRKGVEW